MGLKYVFPEIFSLIIQFDIKVSHFRLAEFVFSDQGISQRLPLHSYDSLVIIVGTIAYGLL